MGQNIAARWCTVCNGGPHSNPAVCPVGGPDDNGTGTEPDGRVFASPNNSRFWAGYDGCPPWADPDNRSKGLP